MFSWVISLLIITGLIAASFFTSETSGEILLKSVLSVIFTLVVLKLAAIAIKGGSFTR